MMHIELPGLAPSGYCWHLTPGGAWELEPYVEPPVRWEIWWGGRWQVAYYSEGEATRFLPGYVAQFPDAHIVVKERGGRG